MSVRMCMALLYETKSKPLRMTYQLRYRNFRLQFNRNQFSKLKTILSGNASSENFQTHKLSNRMPLKSPIINVEVQLVAKAYLLDQHTNAIATVSSQMHAIRTVHHYQYINPFYR